MRTSRKLVSKVVGPITGFDDNCKTGRQGSGEARNLQILVGAQPAAIVFAGKGGQEGMR